MLFLVKRNVEPLNKVKGKESCMHKRTLLHERTFLHKETFARNVLFARRHFCTEGQKSF